MKFFPLYISLLFLIAVSACHRERVVYAPYPAGPTGPVDTNRFNLEYVHPGFNGHYASYYYGTGTLRSEGNYNNGIPSGYWKFYYPDGRASPTVLIPRITSGGILKLAGSSNGGTKIRAGYGAV